ncbi:MAG TPA: alpha/beta hydrolase [Ilumatobacteraceae bacterium]|nr:alpha/beta hydrolase [Ilumatobacteraceae bacterium]
MGSRRVGDIAVHELSHHAPEHGETTVLFAHATGFHAHCWLPVAAHLPNVHSIGYDARGHGDTPIGPAWEAADSVDWTVYGADATAVATVVAAEAGAPLVGVGHSMGGAALIMAALARPELFRALVVYEPIVIPPITDRDASFENPLASGARRRRATFPDVETAIANYASKPPMSAFADGVVDAYVRYGFGPALDDHGEPTGEITLKCRPEHEARTYEAGGNHATWKRLAELQVPIWVLSGQTEPMQPSSWTETLAAQIPKARFVRLDDLRHFGPLEAPAAIVAEADAATR